MQMEFVHNAGQLVTACTDDSLNLWEFKKGNSPELIQSLQLSKEHITTFCLEFQVSHPRNLFLPFQFHHLNLTCLARTNGCISERRRATPSS